MHLEKLYSLFCDTTTAIQIHKKYDTNEELDKVEDNYLTLPVSINALLEPLEPVAQMVRYQISKPSYQSLKY